MTLILLAYQQVVNFSVIVLETIDYCIWSPALYKACHSIVYWWFFFLLVESRRHNHVVYIVQHSNFLIKNICSQLLYIYWGKWHKDCEEYKRMSFHTWHDHQLSCDFEWTGGEYYICLSAVMPLLASFLDQLPSFGTNLLAFSLAPPASSGVVSVSQGSVLGSFSVSQLFKSGGWVLELQLQHQSFQWIFRTDFL